MKLNYSLILKLSREEKRRGKAASRLGRKKLTPDRAKRTKKITTLLPALLTKPPLVASLRCAHHRLPKKHPTPFEKQLQYNQTSNLPTKQHGPLCFKNSLPLQMAVFYNLWYRHPQYRAPSHCWLLGRRSDGTRNWHCPYRLSSLRLLEVRIRSRTVHPPSAEWILSKLSGLASVFGVYRVIPGFE